MIHALKSQIEQTVATTTSPPLTMRKKDAVAASSQQITAIGGRDA
jgi:hypothetical protein